MKYESIEKYFLNQLDNLEKENNSLKKEKEELLSKIKKEEVAEIKEESKFDEFVKFNHIGQPFYYTNVMTSSYQYKEVLEDNNKSVDWLRECITNPRKFNNLLKLERKAFYGEKVYKLHADVYNFIIDYMGIKYIAVYSNYNDPQINFHKLDNKNYFLTKEKAEKVGKEKVMNAIKEYCAKESKKANEKAKQTLNEKQV